MTRMIASWRLEWASLFLEPTIHWEYQDIIGMMQAAGFRAYVAGIALSPRSLCLVQGFCVGPVSSVPTNKRHDRKHAFWEGMLKA